MISSKTLRFLATIAITAGFATAAQAQASRTWVSGVGDDANPCSRTAPCKTFAGAISKTATGGEIDALDPGGFGAVTITKAMTIDGGGTLASVLVSGSSGIVVNAPTTDSVTLRNLSIHGVGTTIDGVKFIQGKALHIVNCAISNLTGNGINIALGANGGILGKVFVLDTVSQDNTLDGLTAIAGANFVQVSIENSRFNDNGQNGVSARDFSRFSIRNSAALGNT